MAFNLQALLQSLGGVTDPNSITVNATPPQQSAPQDVPVAPQSLSTAQQAALQPVEGVPERKGMFGIKGTLRDILGLVGDSLIGGAGGNLIYTPQRRKEDISDAMVGFSGTPKDQLAAIQRVGLLDPALAQQMYQQYNANQLAIDNQAIQKDRYGVAADDSRAKSRNDGYKLLAQAYNGMTADNYDPQTIQSIVDDYGLPSGFDAPPTFDPKVAQRIISLGTPRSVQVTETQGGRRLEQADTRQAETTRHNKAMENRPTGSRSQPNPTAASIAAPILDKARRGLPLTAGEQDLLTRTGFPANRGQDSKKQSIVEQLRAGGTPGKSSGGSTKFTPGQIVTKGGKRYKVNADGKTATPL